MIRPVADAEDERLLHASPHRVVLLAHDAERGVRVVRKLIVSGAMADAEREVSIGQRCAGAGVVTYLGCAVDAATRRPCITTAYAEGTDLDQLVAERGALPAALACRLLAPVAATLAHLHGLRGADLPGGVCHGDVKPKNLLRTATTTLLLDFEHAGAIPAPGTTAVVQATPGPFQPAEPHSAAFDVYGLGATLRWLLTGGGLVALPQHPAVDALVAALCAPDASQRPAATAAAAALQTLATQLEDDADEAALDAAAAGAATGVVAGDRPGLTAWLRRAHRRLQRLPQLLSIPHAVPTEPAALRREIHTARRVLQCFPRHAPTLHWRRNLCRAAGRMLAGAAAYVAPLRRSEEFAAALTWLRDTEALVRDCLPLPGGCPVPVAGPGGTTTALQRDPIDHLRQLAAQIEAAREELAAESAAILAAEARLDLDGATHAIDDMAARYGGASPTATRQRDQLHRLSFYLERVARAQPNVERVATLWDAVALLPVTGLVAAAATATAGLTRTEASAGVVGLRSLQITLVNLAEEFPHLPQVTAAHEALSQALVHLTDRAWEELDAASDLLRRVPVPVRPLQAALARLDTSRVLDAFVDRPDRPRSKLQDAIESLRLRLDQARATRDRLAEGAEVALARGHWTTGLFDMERAVAELNPFDERDRAEATRLQERLAAARRRRQEVDAAVRRNVELTAHYALLQDDPSSSFAERLQALAARRDCLHMLAMHVAADRAALYAKDLRDVETQMALEQAALAEQRLDAASDPVERARIARHAADEIAAAITLAGQEANAPGRLLRLREHWQRLTNQCQAAVEQQQAAQLAAGRRRRRHWALALGAPALLTAVFLAQPWWSTPAGAAGGRGPAAPPAVAQLPPLLRPAAEALGAAADLPATAATFDVAAWREHWRGRLRDYCVAADLDGTPTPAHQFAVACWDRALATVAVRLDADGAAALPQWTAALARELEPFGLRPSAR